MPRRGPAFSLLLLVLIPAGCARLGQVSATGPDGGSYVCRTRYATAAPAAEVRLTMRPADEDRRLPLRVGQGDWQSLEPVAGSGGRAYANALYAWRSDGATSVLTDIRNVETYSCVADAAAPRLLR